MEKRAKKKAKKREITLADIAMSEDSIKMQNELRQKKQVEIDAAN